MTSQEKIKLMKLVHDGNIRKVIDALLAAKRNESLDKEIIAIASRYNRIKQKDRSGILTFEQLNITENQIIDHLINVIDHPEDEPYPSEKSIGKLHANKPAIWKYIITTIIVIGILLGLAEILNFINIIPSDNKLQLTVFVTDKEGNVAVELEGEINIALGNRSLNKIIGEDGRTNFSDITPDNKGDTIQIGLKAKGWEIAGKNTFVFTGVPITLKVKRDNSLGIIKGMIRSRQEPVEGAEVLINTDTTVFTDARGIFRVMLPEKMQVATSKEHYLLSVSKPGYEITQKYYDPTASLVSIELERKLRKTAEKAINPEEKLKRLRQELKNLDDLNDSGEIDPIRYTKAKASLQTEIANLEKQN